MLVAVVIQIPSAAQLHTGFGIAFGVEFYHLDSVRCYESDKGNKMLLGHRVGDGNKMLILYFFYGDSVEFLRVFRFQSRQSDAAAADYRIAGAVDDISADRADIKLTPQHIGGNIFVGDVFPVHQLNNGDAQRLGQGLQ